MDNKSNRVMVQVATVGPDSSWKTNFWRKLLNLRFIDDKFGNRIFDYHYDTFNVKGCRVGAGVYEISGSEDYREFRRNIYSISDAILFCIDIGATEKILNYWKNEFQSLSCGKPVIVCVDMKECYIGELKLRDKVIKNQMKKFEKIFPSSPRVFCRQKETETISDALNIAVEMGLGLLEKSNLQRTLIFPSRRRQSLNVKGGREEKENKRTAKLQGICDLCLSRII